MSCERHLDKINSDFINYFGKINLPAEEDVLNEMKNPIYPPYSKDLAYENLIWRRIKEELEHRYSYKKFVKTKNKLFELDRYGKKTKDITDIQEYIEETDRTYSKVADVLNILSVYSKENKLLKKKVDSWITDKNLVEQIYEVIS